jgi:hypothetical protein
MDVWGHSTRYVPGKEIKCCRLTYSIRIEDSRTLHMGTSVTVTDLKVEGLTGRPPHIRPSPLAPARTAPAAVNPPGAPAAVRAALAFLEGVGG